MSYITGSTEVINFFSFVQPNGITIDGEGIECSQLENASFQGNFDFSTTLNGYPFTSRLNGTDNLLRHYCGGDTSNESFWIKEGPASGLVTVGNGWGANTSFLSIGNDTGSTNFTLYIDDSGGTPLYGVRNDGQWRTGTSTASPYNLNLGGATNVFVASDGFIGRSVSSRRYKYDIVDNEHGLAEVLKLRNVTFRDLKKDDRKYGGLIAEEVHDLGLTEFVYYNPNQEPESLHYPHMIALLAKAIQEFKSEIDVLKNQITELEGNK